MISSIVLDKLKQIVGPQYLISEYSELKDYSSDGTKLIFMPDAVAFPRSDHEISGIFKLASEERFPVIPRGSGT